MAKGQLEFLKRRLPDSFVTPQFTIGGALVLATNFAAPLIFRRGLENDNEAWGTVSSYAWFLALPLLVVWLNLIPARSASESVWSRAWFAPLIYLLWLAGTCVELWTVAYVDDRHLRGYQFTVVLWVLAWTTFRRANIFEPACADWIRKLAPVSALILPGLGALDGLDVKIAALLYLLNLPLLALAYGRLPVFALGGISMLGAICCMPGNWIVQFSPTMNRGEFVLLVAAGVALGAVAFQRDSRAGFLAAVGLGLGASLGGYSNTIALNAAVLFLFLHQMRWHVLRQDEHVVLGIAGTIWIAQTLGLELANSPEVRIAGLVATITVTVCLRNAWYGLPTSLVPAIASIIALTLHPVHWSEKTAATAPSGLLAILIGFAFLAAGAWDSARRSHRRSSKAVIR